MKLLNIQKLSRNLWQIFPRCNQNRITILIAKKDLSDEAFDEMFQRRRKITEYPLNKSMTIIHTTDITEYEKSSDEDELEEDSEGNTEENESEE